MKNVLIGIIGFLVVLFASCSTDFAERSFNSTASTETSDKTYSGVDARLWSHYQKFENEAASRGHNIDLNDLGITGVIEDIGQDNVAGSCQFGQHISHVTVDEPFWNSANSSLREYVVFHELGHCVLERGHREAQNANGVCLSIMASGTGSCVRQYNAQTKRGLVDELFDFFGG